MCVWDVCVCVCYIFTGSLTGALPWQPSWSAQILSAPDWAQVALVYDDARLAVMRAPHKAVRRLYSASPGAQKTLCAGDAIPHHQPSAQHAVITCLIHWLYRHAQWQGTVFLDAAIPAKLQPEGYAPVWCADMLLLRTRASPE